MPEKYKEWRNFLISFAKKIGKPDPETYVDEGGLKARQGGNGLPAAGDVKIKFTNCTAEEHAKIYRLVRPFDDELVGMFVPFGKVAPELGQKLLGEVIILDCRTKVVINYNYTNTAEKYYRILGKNPEIIYINGSLTVPYKIRTEEVDASIVIGYSNSKESLVPREAFLLKKDLDEL